MLRLQLNDRDLSRVRFSTVPHPLGAVFLSIQAIRPASAVDRSPWPSVGGRPPAEVRALLHLVPATGWLPDFMTPLDGIESIEAGIDVLRSTPTARIRAEVSAAYRHQPVTTLRRRLARAEPETVELLAGGAGRYFQRVLAPHWPRVVDHQRMSVLDGARSFAAGGLDSMLNALHPAIAWRPPFLEIHTWWCGEFPLNGQGILLVPSGFAGPRPRVLLQPGRTTLVVYPTSLPAPADPDGAADALCRVLGRTRAAILRALAGQALTTSTLAARLEISLPNTSEQLAALNNAGLLESRRRGRAVEHSLTDRGAQLLEPQSAD